MKALGAIKTAIFLPILALGAFNYAYAYDATNTITINFTGGGAETAQYDVSSYNTGGSFNLTSGYTRDLVKINLVSGQTINGTYLINGGTTDPDLTSGSYADGNYIKIKNSFCHLAYSTHIPDLGGNGDGCYTVVRKANGIVYNTPFPIFYNDSGVLFSSPIASKNYLNNPVVFSGEFVNVALYDTFVYSLTYNDIGQNIYIATSSLIQANGVFPFQKIINLPYAGSYTVKARLYDSTNSIYTSYSTAVTFSLGSTTVLNNPSDYIATSTNSIQYLTCGTFDLFCQTQNSFIWALSPSPSTLQRYTDLKGQIEHKPPFGYFSQITTDLNNLTASSATSTFALTIPTVFMTNFFTPLRTGLAGVVLLFGGVVLFKRIENIQL